MSDIKKIFDKNKAIDKLAQDFSIIQSIFNPYVSQLIGKSLTDELQDELNFDEKKIQQKLPDGWVFHYASNAFYTHCNDDEQGDEPFFVPSIFVDFNHGKGDYNASIIDRYPIGYCSCGEKIEPLQVLLDINKQAEKGGFLNKTAAKIRTSWAVMKIKSNYDLWGYQVEFNMHKGCL